MKRCFKCNHIYSDDDPDLNFCLLDGTPLVFASDSSFEETVIRPSPFVQQNLQLVRQGVTSVFAYLTIGFLALLVGGATFLWIKSESNTSSVNKTENGNIISNTAKSETTNEQTELNKQKANLQDERAAIEKEKQKLKNEREKLDSKRNESPVANTITSSKPSGGTWFVVLGSFPKNERWKADERLQYVRSSGYDANIVDTDNYPGFRSGFWSVVIGPYSKSDARSLLPRMKSVRSDAYIKSGW